MKRWLGFLVIAAALIAVVGFVIMTVTTATATPAEAAPCICPQIYAPVICDNGKTYPNQCVANCKHAQNCVPTGSF